MDYEQLLERAKKNLPDQGKVKERFEIPKVKGLVEGNKTIITNFQQIATALRRDIKHLLKYYTCTHLLTKPIHLFIISL